MNEPSEAAKIDQEARAEIAVENRRAAIDAIKIKLRQRKSWYHQLFPWQITITKRK